MRSLRPLAVSLCLVLLTGSLHAQILNGQWFKATATASGVAHDFGEDNVTKVKFKKITQYVQLFSGESVPGTGYTAVIWAEVSEDEWVAVTAGFIGFIGFNHQFVGDGALTFFAPGSFAEGGSQGFDVQFVGPSKVKQKNEELKSAKLSSAAALAFGSFSGTDSFTGSAKVTLTRVPESKLPFVPEELLSAGDRTGPQPAPWSAAAQAFFSAAQPAPVPAEH